MTTTTDGPRSTKLRDVFRKALERTVKGCSVEAMEAALPTAKKETLQTVHTQLADFLTDSTQAEFDAIAAQRDIYTKLNQLDDLVEKTTTTPVGTPAGNSVKTPELVALAATTPLKTAHLARLRQKLANVRAENVQLAQQIEPQREQSRTLLAALGQSIATLEGASTAAAGIQKQDVWTIIQTLETDNIEQPSKKRPHPQQDVADAPAAGASSSAVPSASTIGRKPSVEFETNTSPVKRRR